jgi:hypothetical protein
MTFVRMPSKPMPAMKLRKVMGRGEFWVALGMIETGDCYQSRSFTEGIVALRIDKRNKAL